jgi:hypothetical protein
MPEAPVVSAGLLTVAANRRALRAALNAFRPDELCPLIADWLVEKYGRGQAERHLHAIAERVKQ